MEIVPQTVERQRANPMRKPDLALAAFAIEKGLVSVVATLV
jgi:hypothetical protein